MKTFVSKSVKLLLLFLALIWILGFYFEYQFKKDYSDKFIWLNNIEEKHYNYAFIGSSRALNMIDINVIDSVLNTEGINLAMGGADFRTLYMILYSFLEIQNNKIDELYIQVDPFMLYKDSVYNKPNYDHYFYTHINYEEIECGIHKNNRLFLYKVFPAAKYAEFNSVYNLTHFIRSFSESSSWQDTKGSNLLYNQQPFKPDYGVQTRTFKRYITLNEEDKVYLVKIFDFCSKNGIQPTLYGAPIHEYEVAYKTTYPNFNKDISRLANGYNIEYLNYMEEEFDKSFYVDGKHLNYKGSTYFTELLIKAHMRKQLDSRQSLPSEYLPE